MGRELRRQRVGTKTETKQKMPFIVELTAIA